MNPSFRLPALALGLCAAWAFGYFIGGDHHSSSPKRVSLAGATPLPLLNEAQSGGLISTALGRLIEGKSDFQRMHAFLEFASGLDAAALPGAVNEAMQLPLQQRNILLGLLFSRWAELDPAAAVQYALLLPKSANAGSLRRTALTAWAETDFAAALAWAQTQEKGDVRNDSLATIAGALAKRDPAAALKIVADNFTGRDASNAYDQVFSAWAEKDFAGAYAAAQGIADPGMRTRAMRAALNQKVDSDPRLVLEALRTAKLSELRWDIGNRAMSRWLERDLTAARDYALALPAGEMRDQGMQAVARELGRRDPRSGLDWLRELPDTSSRDDAIGSLFSTWASTDSKAALESAHGLPEGRLRDSALSQLAQSLIDTDLTTALGLLKELPAGSTSDNAFQQVAWRWARIDPKGAAEWFIDNLPENNRWSMNQIVQEWARNDPESALKWASALPDTREQKGDILGQVLGNLVRGNPTEAADQFAKLTPEQQASAAGNFAANWAFRDPSAAANWVLTLKDESARDNAIGSVAFNWGQRDPASATRWLEKLPAGVTRDSAVQSFSNSVAQTDPEGALAWALTIGDVGRRDGALQGVVANWVRKDRDAATQWVQTTQAIPAETKARLEPMLKQPKPRNGPQFFLR